MEGSYLEGIICSWPEGPEVEQNKKELDEAGRFARLYPQRVGSGCSLSYVWFKKIPLLEAAVFSEQGFGD